jgi:hypothetical protein
MFKKKEVYSNITPIPSYIPRQLALDILHSHAEIITLNPLVTDHKPTKPPRDASADEFYSTWYDITERIQYIPGTGKLGSGTISFKGCFHDMPWGLQTHIYAPMNIDMRNNWRIAGNQPGEPPEPRELGLATPPEGLYLREDIEIRCNITLVSFVKSQMKAASKILVDRLIKKAQLLDSGVLLAMMENGRLKTINPADRTNTVASHHGTGTFDHGTPSGTAGVVPDEHQQHKLPMSPPSPYHSVQFPPRSSPYGALAPSPSGPPSGPPPGIELPGDYSYHDNDSRYTQDSSRLRPQSTPSVRYSSPHPAHVSYHSDYSGGSQPDDGRLSEYSGYQAQTVSRPISYATDSSMQSPGFNPVDQKHHLKPQELPAMSESREEQMEASWGKRPPAPTKDVV